MFPYTFRSVSAVLLVFAAVTRADALIISSCGTTVPAATVGTLNADLTCTDPSPAVTLGARATLELAGHTVQGISADGQTPIAVVKCLDKKCTILGPGEIVGSDGVGSYGDCVAGPQDGKLLMTAGGQGTIDLHDCSNGVLASKAKLADISAHGCYYGLYAPRMKLVNSSASGNVVGIWTQKAKLQDVDADANSLFGVIGAGVSKVRLINGEVIGNGGAGVIGDTFVISDATVTGNNGYGQSIDIAGFHAPRLTNVTCLKSARTVEVFTIGAPALNGTWSVCSSD